MNKTPKITNERIESRSFDKILKFIYIGGVILILLNFLRYYMTDDIMVKGWGWALGAIFWISYPVYTVMKFKKESKKRSGQYIEWKNETIEYNLKKEVEPHVIQRNQIENINIRLDIIEITEKSGKLHELDISDFSKYKDRIKIKDNFKSELA